MKTVRSDFNCISFCIVLYCINCINCIDCINCINCIDLIVYDEQQIRHCTGKDEKA